MKVPGSDGNSDSAKRVHETAVGDRAIQRKGATETGAQAAGGLIGELVKSQGDTFTVSNVGAQIREELNPVKMAAERRAKIESLKEQIRNGTYAPPINDVARSLGEEISLEVMFGGDALKGG